MQLPELKSVKSPSNKVKAGILILSLLGLGALALGHLMDDDGIIPPSSPAPTKVLLPPIPPTQPPHSEKPVELASGGVNTQMHSGLADTLPTHSATHMLTEVRAQTELRKAQLGLLEVDQKIMALNATMQPAPVVVALPEVVTQETPTHRAETQVISIQGVDGALTARLTTPAGVKTVRVGDHIDSGRIASITITAVQVRNNAGATHNLPFEE